MNARRRRIAKHRRRDRRDHARWEREAVALYYEDPMLDLDVMNGEDFEDDDYGLFFITFGEPAR